MILIAHRGNLRGKEESQENKLDYLRRALDKGYHVEVDVWDHEGSLFLGHDKPQYPVGASFLRHPRVWCHCKNLKALTHLNNLNKEGRQDIHYFWHQRDDATITNKKYIWAYPGKQPLEGSIAVLPELHKDDTSSCIGICSDYIEKYQ